MPKFRYVPPDEFTPESRINWITLGKVQSWIQEKEGSVDRLTLSLDGNQTVYIYILSPASIRVRFNPVSAAPLLKNPSPATIVDIIEACPIKVKEEAGRLKICTHKMEVCGKCYVL